MQLPIHTQLTHQCQLQLLLFCTGYELTIFTTDKKNAGTSNNLQIQLVGSMATSRLFTIRNSSSSKGTQTAGMLQRGGENVLQVATPSLGTITSVRVAHVPPKRNQGVSCGSVYWCDVVHSVWCDVVSPVMHTVEPLYRGHHWYPVGCPVYSGTSL